MAEEPGTIEIDSYGDVTVVGLVGEFDIANTDQVREALSEAVDTESGLVVSLITTDFLDSGALNAILSADRALRPKGREVVLHVNTASIVRRALEVSGLAATLSCTASLDDAITIAGRVGEESEWTTS